MTRNTNTSPALLQTAQTLINLLVDINANVVALTMNKMAVRKKIMFLILVQLVVLLLGLGFLYIHEHQHMHQNAIDTINSALKKTIERENQETKKRYTSRLNGFIKINAEVLESFRQHDLPALQRTLENRVKTLAKEDPFFHSISFIFPNGNIFYRSASQEAQIDNVLDVPFAADSLAHRIPLGGMTVARWGIAYRYSQPVYHNTKFIGTIVFVVKPLRALIQMSEMYGVDSGIFIFNDKPDSTTRSPQQSTHKMTLLASVGDTFKDATLHDKIIVTETCTQFSYNNKQYIKYQPVAVVNYMGDPIGVILPVKDITEDYNHIIGTVTRGAILSTIITCIAMCVLYFGLGVILQRLRQLHTELEQRVERRTLELSHVNQQLELEIIERTQAQNELQLLCQQDGLTEIANRRHFDSILELEWNTAIREKRVLSVLMIDIDYFKNYNDNYGHIEGDKCLHRVAETLADNLRRSRDLVARFGGEEFVCLLPETEQKDALSMANKLRAEIEALAISHNHSVAASVITISIGVCCMSPQVDEIHQLILSRADETMYQAKNAGRNQVLCYDYKN